MLEQLEPQLEHHLAEYKRLRRVQRWSIIVGPGCWFVFSLVAVFIGLPEWVPKAAGIATLAIGFALIGVLEARKMRVWWKDVRERETGSSTRAD